MRFRDLGRKIAKFILPEAAYWQLLRFYQRSVLGFSLNGINKLQPIELSCARPLFIISLTSYGSRLKQAAPFAIASLLKQTAPPDLIVLWVATGERIPDNLAKLTHYGLVIREHEDIRSYKKLVPSLVQYPNDILITADDDIYYPENWLERLKEAYMRDPKAIHCHRAHRITLDTQGFPLPYSLWEREVSHSDETALLFPTTGAGVVYPPGSLDSRATDSELFSKLAPTADDVWFWAMARLKGTRVELLEKGFSAGDGLAVNGPTLLDVNRGEGGNDESMRRILDFFPSIRYQITGISEPETAGEQQ